MSAVNSRPCPVCGGLDRRKLYQQRFTEGPLCDSYDVVICRACGSGFADHIPSQKEMERYYAEKSKYSYDNAGGVESEWDLNRFEATADQIIPYLDSPKANILDIGCATGGLLSVLKRRGYGNVCGVDPSPICADAANRIYGVRVRTAAMSNLSDWDERFDLILMLGVLEHVGEVKTALQVASKLLNSGGRIYCAVPDVERLADCENAPYQQFSVEHVNFFSRHSLARVMAEAGLAEVRSWQWTVEWRKGIIEPVLSGLFGRTIGPIPKPDDKSTEGALERYLDFSRRGDERIYIAIEDLRTSQEPILVWGAGTLTRRLLATTSFADANIVAFVDTNPHIEGRSLAGRRIFHPRSVSERKEKIVICSGSFVREIEEAARKQYGFENPICSILGWDLEHRS